MLEWLICFCPGPMDLAGPMDPAGSAAVIYVAGKITRSKLKEKLRENDIKRGIIAAIDRCNNVVTLKDTGSNKTLVVRGDDVSYELDEGDRIYV